MDEKKCMVFACKGTLYRRGLCKFHHRGRQLLSKHCTKLHCYKPLFGDSLFCRRHFREEYGQCLVIENGVPCSERTYTTHRCRRHYRAGVSVDVPSCVECDRPMFVFNKCVVHLFQRVCEKCDKPVRACGLCTVHYFRQYRRHDAD